MDNIMFSQVNQSKKKTQTQPPTFNNDNYLFNSVKNLFSPSNQSQNASNPILFEKSSSKSKTPSLYITQEQIQPDIMQSIQNPINNSFVQLNTKSPTKIISQNENTNLTNDTVKSLTPLLTLPNISNNVNNIDYSPNSMSYNSKSYSSSENGSFWKILIFVIFGLICITIYTNYYAIKQYLQKIYTDIITEQKINDSDTKTNTDTDTDDVVNKTELSQSINNSQFVTNEPSSENRNNTGKRAYCYVGEYEGIRHCAELGVNDICMSGDIFPNSEMCINPNLRNA